MSKVYDQFDRAFAKVEAYAILHDGKPVARIALKHGAAVTAFVHWIGSEMARGTAGGGGYDRASAACAHAAQRFCNARENIGYARDEGPREFWGALYKDDGARWQSALESAGFTVCNVIA